MHAVLPFQIRRQRAQGVEERIIQICKVFLQELLRLLGVAGGQEFIHEPRGGSRLGGFAADIATDLHG